jgi:hypothetical protein
MYITNAIILKLDVMKLKHLLFLMLLGGILNAQEPYRSLIISESRTSAQPDNYIELTNMGDEAINLQEFKFGAIRPWAPPILDVFNDPWVPEGDRFFMLPDVVLEPGESWVITTAYDFGPAMYSRKVDGFEGNQRAKQIDIYDEADYLVHVREPKSSEYPWQKDSVTTSERYGENYQWVFEAWNGREAFYIEHHFAPGDSAVVDQVGGVFDDDGNNFADAYDVAGVVDATNNSNLIRKFSIKSGNLDFANARGVGDEDSEWIVIPRPPGYNAWRTTWWTVGNHGDYVLDENTLESDVIDVDFAGKTLTVPWGTGRLDDIMNYFEKKPGIAWNYHLNDVRSDSVYRAAKTGDQLTIYVAGNTLQTAVFDIIVAEPTADANTVMPVSQVNIGSAIRGGPIVTNTQAGILGWPRVTKHDHGTDTITGTWHGLPYALRTDSLVKYLEKPANATWEFVWVDGMERPDLKDGDILKVTSQSGMVKEYHIQVQGYVPSHNAYLSAITWPDVPAEYQAIFSVFGWKGDTIPGFNSTSFNYRVQLPSDFTGIPALVAKTVNVNAKVEVKRAVSLSGSPEDRTISFMVTAQDDSVQTTYNVELVKEKEPENIQPFSSDPFISEYVWWDQWSNVFLEIANPGNQPLDLSDYMIASEEGLNNPATMIASYSGVDDWANRFAKYVPGYKWVDESQWAVNPGILVQDLSVNTVVQPGDVFVLGAIDTYGQLPANYEWPLLAELDVQFYNREGRSMNPWGESLNEWTGNPIRKWSNGNIYLYKILNDSIKLGLKPANDPNDFELIDVWGHGDGSAWVIGGTGAAMLTNFIRKPDIYQGNPEYKGSFGTNPDDTEWTWTNDAYWNARNIPWPFNILYINNDIGQHFMNEPTHYKSTVSSVMYKVSEGYSMEEEILGVTTGTTVSTFLGNIYKADEGQTLTVQSGENELGMNDILSMDDVLIVMSADSVNTSQYRIDVTEEGLSSDAVLTSTLYDIEIVSQPKSAAQDENAGSGIISGFEYGTQLSTILNNITIPDGAHLDVIDGNGAYISFKTLNYDTAYVDVTVNSDTYFDVVAENNVTRIVYQLQPNSTDEDAFVLSDVYSVDQSLDLIEFVPRGTSVDALMMNLVPSLGATVKLVDKMGLERTDGNIYQDDKVVVTSANGMVTRVYHLSMLRTQYILTTTYLAYVLSDTYAVDQVEYVIESPAVSIDDFYANITPSMGATAVVVNAEGNEKTTGNIEEGDMLKVTSADGHIEVMYELNLVAVSAKLPSSSLIEIYPNPTTGRLNIKGMVAGNRIQVYNSNGAAVRDMKARSNLEVLSIDDQPAGMYLIVISNNNSLLGRYKAIKK